MKRMKLAAKFAGILLAVVMVLALTGCEKIEDKYIKDLEPLVEKLEDTVKSGDYDKYVELSTDITNFALNTKYEKLDISKLMQNPSYIALANRIAKAGETIIAVSKPGIYELVEMSNDNMKMTADEAKKKGLMSMGTLTLVQGGTGILVIMDDSPIQLNWDEKFITVDNNPFPYEFKNGSLVISKEGVKMVFMKK